MTQRSRGRRLISSFPRLEYALRLLKWRVFHALEKAYARYLKPERVLGDPYEVVYISPSWVRNKAYAPKYIDKPGEVTGLVLDGDWDRDVGAVSDFTIVKAARDRFRDDKRWEDTEYFAALRDRMRDGEAPYGMKTDDDLQEHLGYIESLCESIRTKGYRRQSQMPIDANGKFPRDEREVVVHINRHGQYNFAGGRRRLAIALALGIEKIPVKVNIRHKEWESFRHEVLREADRKGGRVTQPIVHPDLSFVDSKHDDGRLEMMLSDLQGRTGRLLDIGCEWGYFCHRFEEAGFDCTAVERNIKPAYFLRKFRRALHRRFEIVNASIFDLQGTLSYDVVLALNIFHHFLKTKEHHRLLIDLLNRLDTDIMYFGPHNTGEAQMKGAYRNLDHGDFVNLITENSVLCNQKLLGHSRDGRPLYKIWRAAEGRAE